MTQPSTPSALPGVDARLRDALRSGSVRDLGVALQEGAFLVALAERDGVRAVAIAVDGDGTRAVVVFSGGDAAAAWGADAVRHVDGEELLRIARHQQADTVLLDPAGPFPAALPVATLALLGEGLAAGDDGILRQVVPLRVRRAAVPEAARRVLRDSGRQAWVFEREVLGGARLTVGLLGAGKGEDDEVATVAAVLAGTPGLPTLDVVELDARFVEHLASQSVAPL